MLRIAMVVIAAAMLGGCASEYVPPKNGPHATLTLPVYTGNWKQTSRELPSMIVAEKGADGCASYPGEGLAFRHDPPIESLTKDISQTIAGDADMFFQATRSYPYHSFCRMEGWFHAVKDHEYILNIESMPTGGICVFSLVEKDQAGATVPVQLHPAYHSNWYNHVCDSKG